MKKLQYLDREPTTTQIESIFCRGHNRGCLRKGSARDLNDGVDLYCAEWLKENPTVPVIEAPL